MSVYPVVLFIHVVCAFGFFAGLALEGFKIEPPKAMMIPSFLGLLATGGYLASIIGSAETTWLAVALAATIVIAVAGGVLKARSYGFRIGAAIGIVFLMTTKPDLVTSLAAVAVCMAAGLVVRRVAV